MLGGIDFRSRLDRPPQRTWYYAFVVLGIRTQRTEARVSNMYRVLLLTALGWLNAGAYANRLEGRSISVVSIPSISEGPTLCAHPAWLLVLLAIGRHVAGDQRVV